MSGRKDVEWILMGRDDHGNAVMGRVRGAVLNSREDRFIYRDRSVTHTYGKHGLRRVIVQWSDRSTVRHYWRRLRVPWVVWAMFS